MEVHLVGGYCLILYTAKIFAAPNIKSLIVTVSGHIATSIHMSDLAESSSLSDHSGVGWQRP